MMISTTARPTLILRYNPASLSRQLENKKQEGEDATPEVRHFWRQLLKLNITCRHYSNHLPTQEGRTYFAPRVPNRRGRRGDEKRWRGITRENPLTRYSRGMSLRGKDAFRDIKKPAKEASWQRKKRNRGEAQ